MIKVAKSLSPITEKLDGVKEATPKLGEIVKKSDVADGNTQTPAIENKTVTQSLHDTLEKKDNGDVFWNKVLVKARG